MNPTDLQILKKNHYDIFVLLSNIYIEYRAALSAVTEGQMGNKQAYCQFAVQYGR